MCLCTTVFFNISILAACTFRPSWGAASHILCAIIALKHIQILTGDIAQSNILLFIRMDV